MYVVWSVLRTKWILSYFVETFSLTKWISSLTGLVLVWYTGLLARVIAHWLSHQMTCMVDGLRYNYDKRVCIHITSIVAEAKALYSNLILDLEQHVTS